MPPAGGRTPASLRHWHEPPVHTASPPTLCAQMVTPSGTPQGIHHCLPLPLTQQTPEKTQTVDEILAINPSWPPSERNAIRRMLDPTYGKSWPKPAKPVIPSTAELNSKKHNIQTLRQLCDSLCLDPDGRRYALVARLNQRRDYHAWTELAGPWTFGCTLSAAECDVTESV